MSDWDKIIIGLIIAGFEEHYSNNEFIAGFAFLSLITKHPVRLYNKNIHFLRGQIKWINMLM